MAVSIALPSIPVTRTQVRHSVVTFSYVLGPALAAAFALVGALFYARSPGVIRPIFDDSYISLRFAQNLADHGILSFDGVNWSTGATSPLHVAILALLIKYGAVPLMAGIVVGVISHMALAVAVYALTWAIYRNQLAAVLASFAVSFMAFTALDAGNGLETSMFMALVTAAMATYFLARRWYSKLVAGLLIGFAVLTRPEGAFLLPAIFLYRFLAREPGEPLLFFVRDAFILCAPGAAALGGMAGLSLWVNGSIGGTASAKLSFFQENALPFEEKLSIASDNIALFLAPVMTLIAVGAVAARRREMILVALWWAPVLVFYTLLFPGGLTHYFYRYQHPVLPFIAVLAGAGVAMLLTHAWRGNFVAKLAVVAGLVLVIVPVWNQYERWREVYRDSSYETLVDLEGMVRDLNTIIAPDETLATHDIGAIAYYGNFKVVDLVGLVNPDVIPYHKEREVEKYVEETRPDYLLVFPEWDFYFLHIDPGNRPDQYELLKVYEGRNVRISPYLLYRTNFSDTDVPRDDADEDRPAEERPGQPSDVKPFDADKPTLPSPP